MVSKQIFIFRCRLLFVTFFFFFFLHATSRSSKSDLFNETFDYKIKTEPSKTTAQGYMIALWTFSFDLEFRILSNIIWSYDAYGDLAKACTPLKKVFTKLTEVLIELTYSEVCLYAFLSVLWCSACWSLTSCSWWPFSITEHEWQKLNITWKGSGL